MKARAASLLKPNDAIHATIIGKMRANLIIMVPYGRYTACVGRVWK